MKTEQGNRLMEYYDLRIYDNNSYLLDVSSEDSRKYAVYPVCKQILNKRDLMETHLPSYRIRRKKHHLSGSFDGFLTVSQKFIDLYESSGWKGLVFYPIPKCEGFYLTECTEQSAVNETKGPFRLTKKCSGCGSLYQNIRGVVNVYMDADMMQGLKPDTFYRSNLEFWHNAEYRCSLSVSQKIRDRLIEHELVMEKDFREVLNTTFPTYETIR